MHLLIQSAEINLHLPPGQLISGKLSHRWLSVMEINSFIRATSLFAQRMLKIKLKPKGVLYKTLTRWKIISNFILLTKAQTKY